MHASMLTSNMYCAVKPVYSGGHPWEANSGCNK